MEYNPTSVFHPDNAHLHNIHIFPQVYHIPLRKSVRQIRLFRHMQKEHSINNIDRLFLGQHPAHKDIFFSLHLLQFHDNADLVTPDKSSPRTSNLLSPLHPPNIPHNPTHKRSRRPHGHVIRKYKLYRQTHVVLHPECIHLKVNMDCKPVSYVFHFHPFRLYFSHVSAKTDQTATSSDGSPILFFSSEHSSFLRIPNSFFIRATASSGSGSTPSSAAST